MKKYVYPAFEIVELSSDDIITTSPGTETSLRDETDGSWEISVNP